MGVSASGRVGTSFVPHCLDPGLGMVAGLVLVIGGAVLALWALTVTARSWDQRVRRRALGPDVLPPRTPGGTGGNGSTPPAGPGPDAVTGPAGPGPDAVEPSTPVALAPAPGWYPVLPNGTPMWWDGRAWAVAPTLPPVPIPPIDGG